MQWKGHLLASSAVLAAFVGASAHAQARGGAAATTTIEELVVTAEKREQSLQDVPVAVSAFTSEKRDLIGINTVTDLTNFTPGLEYNAQNDRNTLRGVGRNTNVHAAEGSVAQYSDGIYTSSTVEAGKTPLFVDRLEVLRGPQGTLYGRNAIGGAINIISKRPTEDWYAEVRAQYQNYDHYIFEGAASGPTAIPGVQFRIGANYERQTEGWFQNTVPGAPDEGNIIETNYLEGQLKFHFNDRFEGWMKLGRFDWHNDGGGPGSRSFYTPFEFPRYQSVNAGLVPTAGYACRPNTGVTNVIVPTGMTLAQACHNAALDDPRKITSAVPYQVKLTSTIVFASEWIYHFDNFDVKYVGGGTHYHYDLHGPTPVDQAPILSYQLPRVLPPSLVGLPATGPAVVIPGGGPRIAPRYAFSYEEQENWYSHEINIASTNDSPLQWILGGYYYDEVYNQPVSTSLTDQFVQPGSFGVFLASTGPGNTCAFTGGTCPALPGTDRIYDDRPHLEIISKAVFGQIDWKFADQWKLTAGLRYTKDDKSGFESIRIRCFSIQPCGVSPELLGSNFIVDLTQVPTVVGGYPGFPGGLGTPGVSSNTSVDPASGFATRHYDNSWDAVTGTAGVQWDPNPGTMLYARYSRGYKAGGFRIGIDTTIGNSPNTEPEHVDAWEIGLKKDWGRTLQTNIALFYYDYTNDQVPITVAATAGGVAQAQSIFYNIPKAVSQGVELESIWQPIDHLQILFNYSYLDAHITESRGVVDPADPAAIAPGAKPIISFAECAATPGKCTTDVFTGTGALFQAPGTTAFLPYNVGGFQRGQDLNGSWLPNAPRNKVTVNVNYTMDFSPGSLIGSVSWFWRDKQYGSIFKRSYYQAPSWDQWDLRLTWKDRDNKFTVIGFVKNLADSLGYEGGPTATRRSGVIPGYVAGLTGAAGTAAIPITEGIASTYQLTPPRTYGIELQYRF
jgi:iron complex outermembrane receptor protein